MKRVKDWKLKLVGMLLVLLYIVCIVYIFRNPTQIMDESTITKISDSVTSALSSDLMGYLGVVVFGILFCLFVKDEVK